MKTPNFLSEKEKPIESKKIEPKLKMNFVGE